MIPLPLESIRLNLRSHLSALWWLGLLYRRPHRFYESLVKLPRRTRIAVAVQLYLHAVPWMLLVCVMGRAFLFGALHLPVEGVPAGSVGRLTSHAILIAFGISIGLAAGIVFGIAARIAAGTAVGTAGGIAAAISFGVAGWISFGIAEGITCGISGGIAGGMALGVAVGIAGGITLGIAGGIAGRATGGIAGWILLGIVRGIAVGITLGIAVGITLGIPFGMLRGIAFGIAAGIAGGIACGIAFLRAYYEFLHVIFVWPVPHGNWYWDHPVAWDDLCLLPFPRLDGLLLAHAEHAPQAAEKEIERLISDYPTQRMSALRARAALVARKAAREQDLTRLPLIVGRLPEGDKGFLVQSPRIREMVDEIGQLQIRLGTVDRPVFREPTAQLLCAQIELFRDQVAGFREPLASEFRAAAQEWLKVAQSQLDQARAVVNREPTPQVFRAGDPVDRAQEAFVPRNAVFGELDRQIMLSTGCPGLVLYGRRRVGKSTVLRNVSGFIPASVHIATMSMQDPNAFTSVQTLVETIASAIRAAGLNATAEAELPHDLPGIFNFLSSCDSALKRSGERLLLAVDEYENIDEKIGEGVFPQDLLATLRESMQTHRQVTWVLTGSHEIAELKHAPWTSYLVSARTVEVLPFSEAETRLLLTEPLKHSSMWDRDDPKRPRFSPSFWGEGGIERIHAEAGGWPHLVQLIAETLVDLLNDTEQRQVEGALLERALDKALVRGDTVLRELMERECVLPGEWDYLRGFRTRDLQPPPGDEATYRSLRRRLLVSDESGQWRLRVPLMQRWLRERG